MKKIYIVSNNGIGNSGGVERVCYYLSEILSKNYEIKIIESPKVSFGKFNIFLFSIINSIRLVFKRNKIVISNSWQLFSFKSDFSIHHGTTQGCIKNIPGFSCFSAKIIAYLEKKSAQNAHKILSVSKNCTKELNQFYKIPENKIITLNNFVDAELFFPKSKEKNYEELILLFSGRICIRKGMEQLFALAQYIETINGVRLLIASNDSENSKIFSGLSKTQIKTGLLLKDMNDFYNSGDIFYFPTLYEGFSMSTLEALSCGIPVIGTSFAIPEELESYDFCTIIKYASPSEVIEIAKKLKKQFANKQKEISEIINKDFGKKQYTEKIMQIINDSIGEHN